MVACVKAQCWWWWRSNKSGQKIDVEIDGASGESKNKVENIKNKNTPVEECEMRR